MQAFYDEEGNLVSVEFTAEEMNAYFNSHPQEEEVTQEQNDYSPSGPWNSKWDDVDDFAENYFREYYASCPTNLIHIPLSDEEISEMSFYDTLGLLYG